MTILQRKAAERIEDAYKQAEAHYKRSFSRPQIIFSNRMTKVAGRAKYRHIGNQQIQSDEIRLSNVLLELNGDAFIEDTPGHEAAHLIAGELYGSKAMGHGTYWREVMGVVGQVATQYHTHETPKDREFLYDNGLTQKTLTIIRHNKLQRGKCEWYSWPDGHKVYAHHFVTEL